MNTHTAIYISNKEDKKQLIEDLVSGYFFKELSNLKGAIFSEITLNAFIEEEMRHEHFDVVTNTKNSLLKSSEGERKKALLNHIILQKPEYLIVDNVFGNLDVAAQTAIEKTLEQLSLKIPIIQITNRQHEVLAFTNMVYQLHDKQLVVFETEALYNITSNPFVANLPLSNRVVYAKTNPLVEFHKVSVSYGDRPIIKDITWSIKSGEFWQLIGANGSGKSTILSMIYGDNPKAYGQDITLFGMKKGSGESIWDIKSNIGYFSSDMLRGFKRLDSIGNMIVSGFFDSVGLYKTPTHEQIKITHQWLQVLNMFEIRKQDFLSLSTGHQRLVLIARAMVKQPPLLILDEPTNGLDDVAAKLFIALINKIALETSTAILYVSHRKEIGLNPDFVFELEASELGSSGRIVRFN